jgi:hypothetical protein
MTDIEALRLRLGTGIDYQTFDLDALAPLKIATSTEGLQAAPPPQPQPTAAPVSPAAAPVRQAFGPVSAPLITTPSPALAFTQYAQRPADSRLDGSVLLTDLFKRLEDHAH